jgi:hypothetical protein
LVSPENGDAFFKIEKGTVAIFLSVIYFIISLAILLTGWWKGRVK